ncbi:MAG TPA: helix-turn-helix domain-containing protein [Gaiellaceae bacterium]|nr:helix-turn-helix domain-containing protein [Gaiellaceae bacterium]
MKKYGHYCPMAHALDLVGERWSLLVVRELLEEGPLRYTDLHHRLTGCGTNILAARLKDLERGGVVRRRRLPPPAASTVYELTEYGEGLRSVMHELAHWGARSLGPPATANALEPGWLAGALRIALPPTSACIEFRIGDEVAFVADGDAFAGAAENPEAVVEGDVSEFYDLLVNRDLDAIAVRGSTTAMRALLDTLPPQCAAPAAAAAELASA